MMNKEKLLHAELTIIDNCDVAELVEAVEDPSDEEKERILQALFTGCGAEPQKKEANDGTNQGRDTRSNS